MNFLVQSSFHAVECILAYTVRRTAVHRLWMPNILVIETIERFLLVYDLFD